MTGTTQRAAQPEDVARAGPPARQAPAVAAAGARPAGDPGRARSARLTLLVMASGLFLAVMSTTVVGVALPTIGRELHASATEVEWIVDAYVIVYASLLAVGGALGDRHGRTGLFMLGVGIFGLGALICGLAPSVGLLLTGRVIQGLGPALLVPGSLTILRATFEDSRQRARAVGVWSMASGLALALGPPVGGLLVSGLGWRWVFLFNVPLAVALVLLARRFVPRLPASQGRARLDWPGAVLVTFALGALAFATIEGQARGWAAVVVLVAFAAGSLAMAGFIVAERRRPDPLIDLSLFSRASFTAANTAAFVVFFAFVGGIVYFSAYFQEAQGRSAVGAGLDVAAIGISYALAATWSGRLVGRVGERWPLLAGLVLAGAAMLGLLRLEPGTPVSSIWWNFALLGAGVGLCGTPMSTMAMSAVAASRAGLASAIVNTMRQVGQVFGIAVLGALVYAQLPAGSTGGRLSPDQASEFVAGLHHALWLSGIALLAAAILAAVLRAGDRRVDGPPMAESVDCGYDRHAD